MVVTDERPHASTPIVEVLERRSGVVDGIIIAVALLPFLAAVLSVITYRNDLHAYSDLALIEMNVRDVPTHLPLVGAYSRNGWNHPGPLLYYALAPLYWLTGGADWGLNLGMATINAAAALIVLLTVRALLRRTYLVVAGILLALLAFTLGADRLVDYWNPSAIVVPLAATCILAWAYACGRWWGLLGALATASYVVQSHVAAVPLVVAAIGVAVVVRAIAFARRSRQEGLTATLPGALRLMAVAALVGLVLWLPPIIQQLSGSPGNLSLLADWARTAQPKVAPGAGLGYMSWELAFPPGWLGNQRPTLGGFVATDPTAPVMAAVFLAGVVANLTHARRSARVLLLALVAAAAYVAGVVAVDRITDEAVFLYVVYWSSAVGWLVWFAMAALVVAALPADRLHGAARLGVTGVGAIALAVTVVAATTHVWRDDVVLVDSAMTAVGRDAVGALANTAETVLDPNRPVTVTFIDEWSVDVLLAYPTLVLDLEKRGYDVSVAPGQELPFGRRSRPAPAGAQKVYVAVDEDRPDPPGARPLAAAVGIRLYYAPDG